MKRALVAAGLTAMLIASGVMTNQSAEAQVAPATARVVTDHPRNTTRVVIRYFDKNGDVVSKRVLGKASEGRVLALPKKVASRGDHDTGQNPVQGGRVNVTHNHYSMLGSKLYSWTVWSKWTWHRNLTAGVCFYDTSCEVNMVDKGWVQDTNDQNWDWKGVQSSDNHWMKTCGPHCGYHHQVVGSFDGLSLGGPTGIVTVHQHPSITLDAFNDGGFEWWYNCC